MNHGVLSHASIALVAGALGGLTNSVTLWVLGAAGVTAALGIAVTPTFTPAWLYPRLVWGALWGLLFLLPIGARRWWSKALLLSLAPSAVQLLIVFPFVAGKGWLGLQLGMLTPLLVLVVNGVWGLTAIAWISMTTRAREPAA